jgi:hypothetical protein
LIPQEREEKDTTKGTTRIYAKPMHQMGHMLGGQKEGEKQATPFTK